MKAARRTQAGNLFDRLTPEMSFKEVGALLGLSDSCAMRTERSAGQKIEQVIQRLNLSSINEFSRVDDERIDEAVSRFRQHEQEYSERAGWYPLSRARSINHGTESLRDTVVSVAVLRLLRKACWAVPLLCRRPKDNYRIAGKANTVIMLGDGAMFRSADLRALLRREGVAMREAVAVVESERGCDAQGAFEVPLLRAIAVSCDCLGSS
jgi:hypothetical protein